MKNRTAPDSIGPVAPIIKYNNPCRAVLSDSGLSSDTLARKK